MQSPRCPFCKPESLDTQEETQHLVAFRDKFPVSPGHTLIVPRRHVNSFFELRDEEKAELLGLVEQVKEGLDQEFRPSGFNVGWNDGASAGQTVFHFHLHVIPRYDRDVADPRGGVRWVLPENANYWGK
jgi:diadenosine tetraphosphate (Ap4A) HIT family hydrolase